MAIVFIDLVLLCMTAILAVLAVSQVLIPLWNGKPIFPMWRRGADLESNLAIARAESDFAALERAIHEEEERAARIRDHQDNQQKH
jgi:hypothetical protein